MGAVGDAEAIQDGTHIIKGRRSRDDLASLPVDPAVAVEDDQLGALEVLGLARRFRQVAAANKISPVLGSDARLR